MIEIILKMLNNFWGGVGTTMALLIPGSIFFIHYFEKIEKILAHLCSVLRKTSTFADKQFAKRDLQGRMNDFVKRLDKKMHSFVPVKMNIKFSTNEDLEGFDSGGKYLIRVKRGINPNTNFVNIAMFFISKHLLLKAKKQISPKQQQSIDLFVAKKLFEEEKESVMSEFVDSFLQPKTDDDKIREMFDKHTNSDRAGLFFPVFLQEMVFLGGRVFSNPKNHRIQEEVASLINFLDEYSKRKIGDDDIKNKFDGQFSKFALMIVGISYKVEQNQINRYTKYIENLIENKIESIYLIGDKRNKDFITEVGKIVQEKNNTYNIFKEESYTAAINNNKGRGKMVENFLLVLKKKNPDPFIQNHE